MVGITRSLSTVGVPIMLAGLTTILGFLSFTGVYLTARIEKKLFHVELDVGFFLIQGEGELLCGRVQIDLVFCPRWAVD
jgi:hypothetical protein